jgi:hypothetical protein
MFKKLINKKTTKTILLISTLVFSTYVNQESKFKNNIKLIFPHYKK